MGFWIFQADPRHYRILEAMASLTHDLWILRAVPRRLAVGDAVFIWKASAGRGIYGIGRIEGLSSPGDVPSGPLLHEAAEGGAHAAQGVLLSYDRLLLFRPLRAERLKREPALANHRILGSRPQGTVFRLSETQGRRLMDLCHAERRGWPWTREELVAALDLHLRRAQADEAQWAETIRRVARCMDRTPRSLADRLRQFDALSRCEAGVLPARIASASRGIFSEFARNRALLSAQARAVWRRVLGTDLVAGLLDAGAAPDVQDPPRRLVSTVQRIIRDTRVSAALKERYDWKCQICGVRLSFPDGRGHAEAHHIRPLGSPHDGPDAEENLLVLCPNHHAQFDYGLIAIDPEMLTVIRADPRRPSRQKLRLLPGHRPAEKHLRYHLERIFGKG